MGTISEKLTYLEETKELIKQAIVDKGVEVNDTDTFRSYADKISEIEGGGGGGETVTFTPSSISFAKQTDLTEMDLSDIDGSKFNTMFEMFSDCTNLTSVVLPETIGNVTSLNKAFYNCHKLNSIDGLTRINTENVINFSYVFSECYLLENIDVSGWNTSKGNTMADMFRRCENVSALDVSNFDTSNVTNMSNMFSQCYNIETLDVSKFNTSKVTTFSHIFGQCKNLKTIIGLSNFTFEKVPTYYGLSNMFNTCESIENLNDVNDWDVSNITKFDYVFNGCKSLKNLDLSGWDTSKATDMRNLFFRCENLETVNVSSFNTSNVTQMDLMFSECYKLTSLDLSNFNTSKVTQMYQMFKKCGLTTLDLSNFETSKVTNFAQMFTDSQIQKLVLSNKFVVNATSNTFLSYKMLRDLVYDNFGHFTKFTIMYLEESSLLGVNSEDFPDSRQHLTDTFITNSCDRTAQGLGTLQVKFSPTTLALFTEDEIAQATAKGYTYAA